MELIMPELAEKLVVLDGCKGDICWHTSKHNGTPKTQIFDDSFVINLGWGARVNLCHHLVEACEEF